MDALILGKSPPLSGSVRVGTSKNAVLPILAASLLCQEPVTIREVPQISDVEAMYELLACYGADILVAPDACRLSFAQPKNCETTYELVRRLRASFLVAGPLLTRVGEVSISLPGGCAIGARPVDLHLKGFAALGAQIEIDAGTVHARCKRLRGAPIYLDYPSVGATENIMMAAVLARGRTVIHNAATEPEVVDLAAFLNAMGAHVRGAGTDAIRIDGVRRLKGGEYTPIPDRIETGTLLIAASIAGGDITLENVRPDHIQPVKAKLVDAGMEIEEMPSSVRIIAKERPNAVHVKSMPYPGFPTDLQAPMMAMACMAEGTSVITETVFENRFMHVPELVRMGAKIHMEDRNAVVEGQKLTGAYVCAPDLRGAAALVLAALAAEGESHITGLEHLDRGYDHLEKKLASLGAIIRRETISE